MDEPGQKTAHDTVSICATAPATGGSASVNDLERAIPEASRAAAPQLYEQALAAVQKAWLAERHGRFSAQRWRTLHWLTPFGLVARPACRAPLGAGRPLRLVREKASGRYLTFSKVFFRPKASRLLLPALEQEACAVATEQKYHPAAPRPSQECPGALQRSGFDLAEGPATQVPWPWPQPADRPERIGTGREELRSAINRRFKRLAAAGRPGSRGWPPLRAERLLGLDPLRAQPRAWADWWSTKPQFRIPPYPP